MQKILITGITGFAGSFLAEHLVATRPEAQVYGTYLTDKSLENVASIKNKVQLEKIDLTNFETARHIIAAIRPEQVYHLAALPSTAESLKDPASFLSNNINAQLYLLEALREQKLFSTRVLVIGSGMVYGRVKPRDLPVDEEVPLSPDTPYDVSKITQDFMGLQYFNAYGMPIIRVRPFNHAGPRLSDHFVISAFSKKIAEIEKGKNEPILTVGNLDSKRDFTDVRDMVRAYSLLMEKGTAGEVYNLGSGTSYKIGDLLHILLSFSQTKIEVKFDESLSRPNDIPDMVCNAAKFRNLTGWKPEIPIEKTLQDTLEFWRKEV